MSTRIQDLDLPDLVAGTVDDLRDLVEAEAGSLRTHVGERLGELAVTIRSWLIALCVAIVTMMLLGIASAATLTEVIGLPWYASLWIVTALAIGSVVLLVYRARTKRMPETPLQIRSESS